MGRDLSLLRSRLERIKAIHSLLIHTLHSPSKDLYVDDCDLEQVLKEALDLGLVTRETVDLILSVHREFHLEVEKAKEDPNSADVKRAQVLYLRLNELIDHLMGSLDIN
jgi:hypothetical protein